jgi:hypothetical protein
MLSFAWIALAQSIASASALVRAKKDKSRSFSFCFSKAALDYVDFPTQTLGKCAKPISILVTGLFFFSKKGGSHGWKKSVTTVLVCAGISVFFLGKGGGGADAKPISMFGIGLIVLSLVCDGIVGGLQSSLKGHSHAPNQSSSPYQMMLYINFWSVWLILAVLVMQNQLAAPIFFLMQYPSALLILLGLNVSMAFGQIFIYALISSFDPLVDIFFPRFFFCLTVFVSTGLQSDHDDKKVLFDSCKCDNLPHSGFVDAMAGSRTGLCRVVASGIARTRFASAQQEAKEGMKGVGIG